MVAESVLTKVGIGVQDMLADLDLGCPVIFGAPVAGKPDQATVYVGPYDVGDVGTQITSGVTVVAVQVTIRGSAFEGSTVVRDRYEAIWDALTWTTARTVNGVLVSNSLRKLKSGPVVADGQGRPTAYLTVDMTVHRLGLIPA